MLRCVWLPWSRLVRAGALFSPAADVVAGMALAGTPWSVAAVRTVLASVCVYAAGMVLNDYADREEDAKARPERPLPRGEIRPGKAAAAGLALATAGIALSAAPLWHFGLVLMVLLYDFVAKRWHPSAIVVMGCLRGLNLLGGAWFATHTVGTPALAAALCYAVAVAAITGLGICEDGASAQARTVGAWILLAVGSASLGVLLAGGWLSPAAVGVPLAALAFVRLPRGPAPVSPLRIRKEMLKLLLGCLVYTAALCAVASRWLEAGAILGCAPLARAISRRIQPT